MEKLKEPRTTSGNKYLNYLESYNVNDLQKCVKRGDYDRLFRGLSFPTRQSYRTWYNNEVIATRGNKLTCNFKTITSWTNKYKIANGYSKGKTSYSQEIQILLILTPVDKGDIFCDLHYNNIKDSEILLKPGKYTIIISEIASIDTDTDDTDINDPRKVLIIKNTSFVHTRDSEMGKIYQYHDNNFIIEQPEKLCLSYISDAIYKYLHIPIITRIFSEPYILTPIDHFEPLNFRNIEHGAFLQILEKLFVHQLLGNNILNYTRQYDFPLIAINIDSNKIKFINTTIKRFTPSDTFLEIFEYIYNLKLDKLLIDYLPYFYKFLQKLTSEFIYNLCGGNISIELCNLAFDILQKNKIEVSNNIAKMLILNTKKFKEFLNQPDSFDVKKNGKSLISYILEFNIPIGQKWDTIHFLTNIGASIEPEILLDLSAEYGDLNSIKKILKQQPFLGINNAFIQASGYNHFEIVEYLLKNGADINSEVEILIQDIPTTTNALINSAKNGHFKIVEYLVKNGADVHINGDEALIDSAKNGHFKIVEYLLEHGPSIHACDTAFIYSARNGNFKIVKYFVQNDINIQARSDALIGSARNGQLEIVKYLLQNGANIHVDNDIALFVSIESGHLDIVKYLVENGANIHTHNHLALDKNYRFDIVKYLIEHGAK